MRNLIRGTIVFALAACSGMALADPAHQLSLAAQMDNAGTVAKLLTSGVSANTLDPVSGEPVLLLALREGSKGVIDLLVASKDLDTERSAPNGNTALMMAALKQNRAAVEKLLARGAAVNRKGWNALHFAAAGGDAAIVLLLLDKGAAIDAVAPNGMTPLMLAATEGQPEAVDALLRRGANLGFVNSNGQSAREGALYRDRPDIVKMIDAHLARAGRK